MIYSVSPLAIVLFVVFVLFVLGISFYFGNKTKSTAGYYAAGGTIHWAVNGIAFAGDYLSAASFLGICGMIAFSGYDGFLYSIGYLAGWVVALFVVAEPLKRMGKYTFADALDSTFNNKGIQLAAAVSTLIVSICYLIPQMVGAGDLVTPLLGMPHWVGVILVGGIVIFIVATAGMTSTTYVQFIKGGLLIIFSTILSFYLISNGLAKKPSRDYHEFKSIPAVVSGGSVTSIDSPDYKLAGEFEKKGMRFVKLEKAGIYSWWKLNNKEGAFMLEEALSKTVAADGATLYNGEPQKAGKFFQVGHIGKLVKDGQEVDKVEGLDPFSYISTIEKSEIISFAQLPVPIEDGSDRVTVWYQKPTSGSEIMRPGLKFKVDKGATPWSKLNFISLMLALFFGTAALPHILIRYYTVPSAKDARKSTIVAIAAIGFFYILTLYMGLGAMTNGVLDVESSNMSAPLLAKYFGIGLFSVISAIAFATVLGTVSGLIVASSGAVAHDLMDRFLNIKMTDKGKVKAGKIAAIFVGGVAIILGILFKGMNVSFLVGWAFSVAASANLPAILMLLFWKKTTAKGIAYSILVGIVSSLTIILLSPEMYEKYGVDPATAPIPLSNPGIISIPLSFLTLIVVSLVTKKKEKEVPIKK
ncbi:MAG: cation/acetate symporter [Acidobacteriota bacterium]|nr:cation/acetate symporter [Acidobacteriota bacterium]